ncbi:MAG: sigma 54-interacting transcriptional regulator, partial [bacterium]
MQRAIEHSISSSRPQPKRAGARKPDLSSIEPYSLLGIGAALALYNSEEDVARFIASAVTSALRVKFGAVALQNPKARKLHLFGQFNHAPLQDALAAEIVNFLSPYPKNSDVLANDNINEIEVHKQQLPQSSAMGLCRFLIIRLRTLGHDFGVVIAGQSCAAPFSPTQIASLQTLTSQAAMTLHRIQLNQEQAANEAALRASEARYRTLYHHTPVMMHSIDRNGKLVSVNDFWLTTLGYEREEVIGRNSTEFLTEESQRYFKEVAFPEFLKTGFAKDVGYQMVKKNGEVIDILLSAIVEKDVTGEMNHTMAFMVDITERKWAEQALLESEERLFRILESAMDAIVAIDNDWQIVLFNEAAEKIFRCPASRAVGHAFDRYLSENFYSLLKSYLKDCQTGKRDKCYLWARDGVTALRADGEEFPVDGTVSQFEMAGRKLYTIILRDINDLMQAEQKLHKLQLEKAYLEEEVTSEYNLGEIVGASKAMQTVYQNIEKVAATDSTVLLTGETGTGKELIARAIHKLSSRKESVMVNVNCAALPMGLVESELFGHVKGAFTGASTKKKGRFELADGGTILLDEVGELPLETQTKLLRVLQEQEFEHVGGTQTKKVNVRVIAASNQNLEEIVKQGGFRADLFYRLNIFPIHIPALRDRLDDIPLLTNYF